ncbi:hypothetical protein HND97_18400 [Vibrio cholerae]|nr:hypothetical protein HND97_18400 [Vibrio cholerae]
MILKSIELRSSDKYRNGDLVVMSDFIAPKQSDELLAQVAELKTRKTVFMP